MLANVQAVQQSPLIIFATGTVISEQVRSTLEKGAAEAKSKAKELGYVIEEVDGDLYIRDRDLLNIESFELKLQGLAALARVGSSGGGKLALDNLEPAERAGIWEFFRRSGHADTVGPVYDRKGFTLAAGRDDQVTFSDGTRSMTIPYSGPSGKSEDTILPTATEPEISAYTKTVAKMGARKTDRGTELSFYYFTKRPSISRLEAAGRFTKMLEELVRSQNERYLKARAQVKSAWPGKTFDEGASIASLPEFNYLEEHLALNYKSSGFSSADEARTFVKNARVKSVSADVIIGFRLKSGDRYEGRFLSTTITRFGGP